MSKKNSSWSKGWAKDGKGWWTEDLRRGFQKDAAAWDQTGKKASRQAVELASHLLNDCDAVLAMAAVNGRSTEINDMDRVWMFTSKPEGLSNALQEKKKEGDVVKRDAKVGGLCVKIVALPWTLTDHAVHEGCFCLELVVSLDVCDCSVWTQPDPTSDECCLISSHRLGVPLDMWGVGCITGDGRKNQQKDGITSRTQLPIC